MSESLKDSVDNTFRHMTHNSMLVTFKKELFKNRKPARYSNRVKTNMENYDEERKTTQKSMRFRTTNEEQKRKPGRTVS